MNKSTTTWVCFFFMVLFAMVACVVIVFGRRCNQVYKAEREFVFWHDAEVTNRLSEIDSGARGYVGPSASFVFEERLMMYSPTCVVDRVIARLRKDYPTIDCSDLKIRDILSSAEYFNSGRIVPHIHIIVRSDEENISASVAESFVNAVADVVEEDSRRTRLKAVEQIQNRLLRLHERRRQLTIAPRATANAEMELRRIDTAIEGLDADIERVKSLGNDTELRVFRIRRRLPEEKYSAAADELRLGAGAQTRGTRQNSSSPHRSEAEMV